MNKQLYSIALGCVADDFTGASDVASFLAKGGARCLLINGVPGKEFLLNPEYDAVVIALKTRNTDPKLAIEESIKSFDWLLKQGAKTIYFKYCSTFDSTPRGNIGPVLDKVLEKYNINYTILCPALPVNKRIVKEGILYVDGQPLDETPMKNHPVNPMWSSSLVSLMEAQSKYPCFTLNYHEMSQGKEAVMKYIEKLKSDNKHFYVAVDYFQEKHGEMLAELFKDLKLLSGGSALPVHIFKLYSENNQVFGSGGFNKKHENKPLERGLILSGSCSVATRNQIQNFISAGGTAFKIEPELLMNGSNTAEDFWKLIMKNSTKDVLIYSLNDNETVAKENQAEISKVLEGTLASIGRMAVKSGINNIVVAGGETSGAVIKSLGCKTFEIGKSLSPGVPILFPKSYPNLKIALKSGNFGQPDFFNQALSIMKGEKNPDEYTG